MSEYPFRILIIEDNKGWYKYIALALEDSGYRVDIARTINQADHLLGSNRYHYISCDLKMPAVEGGPPAIDIGVPFTQRVSAQRGQMSLMDIFTATVLAEPDPRIVGSIYLLAGSEKLGGPYLKSLDGIDYAERNEYSAIGWSERIIKKLESNDLPVELLRRGKESLPAPLSVKANLLSKCWSTAGTDPRFWLHLRDLYSMTLLMVSAQMSALRNGNEIPDSFFSPGQMTDLDRIRSIGNDLNVARKGGGIAFWKPYFMDPRDTNLKTNKNHHEGNIGDGLVNTLNFWRKFRNKHAHEAANEAWESLYFESRTHIIKLVDLISFWARHPLFSGFKYIDSKGTAEATTIRGSGSWPLDTYHLDSSLVPKAGHVYLKLSGGKLVDLYPWLHTDVCPINRSQRTLFMLADGIMRRGKKILYRKNILQLGDLEVWNNPSF